jgi:hypothetical protein
MKSKNESAMGKVELGNLAASSRVEKLVCVFSVFLWQINHKDL